ncbi:MAG: MoaD/ThiS family protein, partial [Polynucleobacter sp.]
WAEALAETKAIRMALNHEMVDGDVALVDQAEVAFFPPVTGG